MGTRGHLGLNGGWSQMCKGRNVLFGTIVGVDGLGTAEQA